MRIIIDKKAAALEHAHSLCRERDPAQDPDDTAEDNNNAGAAPKTPYDLVLWTDASATPKNQAGPGGGAVVYRRRDNDNDDNQSKDTDNDKPAATTFVWNELSFGILGHQQAHQVKLFAILYALRVALREVRKVKEKQGDADDAKAERAATSSGDMEIELDDNRHQKVHQDGTGQGAMGTVQILTDCQEALIAIRQRRSQKLSDLAAESTSEIEKYGITVELRWVPGHQQVVGHRMADMLARRTRRRLAQTPMNFGKKGGLRRMGLRRPGTRKNLSGWEKLCGGTFLIWPGSNGEMVWGITLECAELAAVVWAKNCDPIVIKPVQCLQWDDLCSCSGQIRPSGHCTSHEDRQPSQFQTIGSWADSLRFQVVNSAGRRRRKSS